MIDLIKMEIEESISVKEKLILQKGLIELIEELINKCIKAIKEENKIIFCGNGGSFADAQHITAEFVSRLRIDRNPLPAIALGTNSSNLSAIANDYGYDQVFVREIIASGKSGDVFIPISTSGNSKNIILAIEQAKKQNIEVFGWTGRTGGEMSKVCKTINIPSEITEKIQESHIMVGHILCSIVEKKIFKS